MTVFKKLPITAPNITNIKTNRVELQRELISHILLNIPLIYSKEDKNYRK